MNKQLFLKSTCVFIFLLSSLTGFSAVYYWVGGSGVWSDLSHWSTTTNPAGPYHINIPTAMDDVVFLNNGGVPYTVTMDAANTIVKCKNMDWSLAPAGCTLTGTGTRADIHGSVTFHPAMNFTFAGDIWFVIDMNVTNTITSNGVHFSQSVYFSGNTGTWNLADALYVEKSIYHYSGRLNTQNFTITAGTGFPGSPNPPGSLILDLGSSTVNIISGPGIFAYLTGNFIAGTSTINHHTGGTIGGSGPTTPFYKIKLNTVSNTNPSIISTVSTIDSVVFNYYGTIHSWNYQNTPQNIHTAVFKDNGTITNANHFTNLRFEPGKTYTFGDYTPIYQVPNTSTDITILAGGTFIANGGGGCTGAITMITNTSGTPVSIINNSGSIINTNNVLQQDIHGSGTMPLINNNGHDLGNCTGWTFNSPQAPYDLYWIDGPGEWIDPNHWSLTNGGSPSGCIPNAITNVHFTPNSGFTATSGDTELINTPADYRTLTCRDLDFSTVTGYPTFNSVHVNVDPNNIYSIGNSSILNIFGSCRWGTAMVQKFDYKIYFKGNGNHEIESNSLPFHANLIFDGQGTWNIIDSMTLTDEQFYIGRSVFHTSGKIFTHGHSITFKSSRGWYGNYVENGDPGGPNDVANKGAELSLGDINGNSSNLYLHGNVNLFVGYEGGKFHAIKSTIKGVEAGGQRIYALNNPHYFYNVIIENISIDAYFKGGIINQFISKNGTTLIEDNGSNNLPIHYAEFKQLGEIKGNQVFDTLVFTGGNRYILEKGKTQTITSNGTLISMGGCDSLVYIQSSDGDATATIKKETGSNLVIDNTIVENIAADLSTGVTYTINNGLTLANSSGWTVINPTPRNLYWVGNGGFWDESAHWATSSGGSGGNCPPTPLDNVFFDQLSFSIPNQTVEVRQYDAYARDMNWTGVTNNPRFLSQSFARRLNSFGDFILSPNMSYKFNGEQYFRADHQVSITTSGNKLLQNIYFDNPSGDWTFTDDLLLTWDGATQSINPSIYQKFGTIRTNHDMRIGGWWNSTNENNKLFLGNSKITFFGGGYGYYSSARFDNLPQNFNAGTSEFIIEDRVEFNQGFISARHRINFYDVTFYESGCFFQDGQVLNKLTFHKYGYPVSNINNDTMNINCLEFKEDGYIASNYPYLTGHIGLNKLKLAPGKSYLFYGKTVMLPKNGQESELIIEGLPNQYIQLNGTGEGTIAMDDINGVPTCTQYVFLSNMTHTGTETIQVPTPGGNVINNTGWAFVPCNPCPNNPPVLDSLQSTFERCGPGTINLVLKDLLPGENAVWFRDSLLTDTLYNSANLFQPLVSSDTCFWAKVFNEGGQCYSSDTIKICINVFKKPAVYAVSGGGSVCQGGNLNIILADSEVGFNYQLQLDGVDFGAPQAGTGNQLVFTITLPNGVTTGMFTIMAIGEGGCSSAMNNGVTGTYLPSPAPVIGLSSNNPVCALGGSIELFENGGQAVSWNWSGPGAWTSSSQNPVRTPVTSAESGWYSCTIEATNGCSNVSYIYVEVIASPSVNQPSDLVLCHNNNTGEINFSGSSPSTNYAWTNNNSSIGLGTSGTGNLPSFTVSNMGNVPVTATIIVTPYRDSLGVVCAGEPKSFTITVNPIPKVDVLSDTRYCAGDLVAATVISGTVENTVFTWTNDNTDIGLGATGMGNLPSFVAGNATTADEVATIMVYPSFTNQGVSCIGSATSFEIAVHPLPTVNPIFNVVVCANGDISPIVFSGNLAATTYNWVNDNPSIGLAAMGTGDIPFTIATNNTANPIVANITVTPSVNNGGLICTGASQTFTLTVNPLPILTAVSAIEVCAGDDAGPVLFGSNVTGAVYNWTNNNTSIGLAANGNGDLPMFTAMNNTQAPKVANVIVNGSYTNAGLTCTGAPIGFTITVNPLPITYDVTGGGIYCNGDNIGLPVGLSNSQNGINYQLKLNGNPIGSPIAGTGSPLSFGNQTGIGVYTVTAINATTDCISEMSGSAEIGTTNCTINIIDPCVCLNNATTLSNGQFSETIQISAPAGQTWTVTASNGLYSTLSPAPPAAPTPLANNTTFVETPAGSGIYLLNARHVDALGYTLSASNGIITLSVGNVCVYPNPAITSAAGPFCASEPPFTFTGNPGDNNIVSQGFTVNGVPSATFDPGVGPGIYTIEYLVDGGLPKSFGPNDPGCIQAVSQQITVVEVPSVINPGNQVLCADSITISVEFNGSPQGSVYNWSNNNTTIGLSASGSGNIPSFVAANNSTVVQTAQITVTPQFTNAGIVCFGPSQTFTISVNPTPNAVATPSTQTICSGGSITTIVFSGNVSGTSYNWTRDNSATVTGIPASGSGNISGILTNTTNAPVIVTFTITPTANGCPGTAITATVLVNPTPNAVAIPSTQTICSGGPITTIVFSGNVSGTSYNWTRDNTAAVTGISASGSGNISGSLTNTTNAPVTVTFTITPTANGCPGTAITATVLVNPTPNAVATPASQTICSGGSIITIVLSGNVSGTSYNWTRDNSATVTGIPSSGSGNISGVLTNTTNAPVTVSFTITPTANGCPGTAITATVLVNPTPNAVATPASQTICSGGSITTIALSGNVSGTSYNWTRDNLATVTGIPSNGSGNISGILTNTTNAPVTVSFTITPTANGCPGTAITATVLVNPTPNAVATPASQTICSGGSITTIALSGNVSGTSYNWTRDNSGTVTGLPSSGSGNISGILTNTTNAPVTVTFTITPTANGCSGTAITAMVLVNPTPNAIANPTTQIICSGLSITPIALTGNVPGTVYSWTRNNPGVTGMANSGTGNIAGTLVSNSLVPEVVTFTIIPSYTNAGFTCTGTAITATVTVNPKPSINAVANQLVCSNTLTQAVSFTGAPPAAFFTWTNNNTSIGLAASGSGNIPAFTATNNTGVNQVATITVTPNFTNGNVACQGDVRTFTITVFPGLIVTPFNKVELCEDATVQLGVNLVQMGVPPYTFAWTGPNGYTSSAASPVISPSIWNVHTGTYNVRVTDSNGCSGTASMQVVVNPTPVFTDEPDDLYICEGNTGNVSCLATVANGSPLSYILQQQAGQSWLTLATNATGNFSVNNVTPAMNGTVYRILAHADHNPMPDCETSSVLFQLFVHDDQGLACNDMVNYSIDENCVGLITADMVMEGDFVEQFYVITLVNAGGQPVPNPIGQNYIGEILTATVLDICTGNSCTGKISIEDKLPPIVTCDQPMCDLLTLSGEWDGDDNAFAPGACWAFDGFAPNPGILYDVLQFTVSVGGNYTFTMDDSPLFDGIAGIYAGNFNANDPCTNLIGGDDDINGIFETEPSFTINLSPGTYYLVSSTWTAGQMGIYNWTFSGPANLQTPCDFTCLDKEGILNGDIELPEPVVFDCSTYTIVPNVTITGNECDGEVINILYLVTDKFGYQASCSQRIAIQPLSIDDVVYPVSPAILTCNAGTTPEEISNYFEDVSYGYPYVINFLGDAQPIDNNTCNIYAAYHDAVIAACGTACLGNSKIVRTWTLLDWCTLETANYVQIIKAVDTKAPTFIVKDVTVSVNPWGCVANFQAPMPWELQDNCDAHPVWWLEGPAGVVITGNPTDGYFVTGAPKGRHAFTYKAVDCCGNIGSAVAYVTVIDRSAPVAVAKQNIVISLTGSGTAGDGAAKLYAWMVDNGSYDHCTAVKLEIRRPDGAPDCGNLGVDDHNNNVTFDDDDSASPQVRWAHPNDDRDDTDNGAYVKFCCEDLGSEISVVHQVIMRVWDDGNMNGVIGDNLIIDGMQDNYNETWADIRVENKIPPVLVCPLDATITCDMELNLSTSWKSVEGVNLTMTGGPATAYDLCNGIAVEYKDTPSWTNTCENVGRIRREFRAIKGDKTVNCYQTITVNALPSTFVVTPPSSSVLDAPCDFNESDIKDSDKPKVQGGPCDVIGENIHIDTFLFEDGVCKKWRVTYNYINWCTGEQKGPYTKYYKFKDDEKPVLTCQDQMFAANPNPQNPNGTCEGTVNLEATATDGGGCTANGWLKWQVFVDLWGNGTTDLEFSSFLPTTDNNINNDTNQNGINDRYVAPTASGGVLKVPAFVLDAENSVHKVQWKVTDGCGNVTDCYSTFMVVDKKAPTPYCISLSSAVMQNGQVELWAIDFDKGSFDNCTPRNALLYTFNGEHPVLAKLAVEHYFKGAGLDATVAEYNAGNAQKWVPAYRSSAMIFNCDDVEASPITLNMNVWDARLNTDFCSVELTLIDNQGGCGGSRVAGNLTTKANEAINTVTVKVDASLPEFPRYNVVNGSYDVATPNGDMTISASKTDDYTNGVSTLDLVLIQRHILGLTKLDSPEKLLAADVNKDGKVTASDLVELRKLILSLSSKLSNNDSWIFVPKSYTYADANNPWNAARSITVTTTGDVVNGLDFTGIKVGDVNNDAVAATGVAADSRSSKVLKFVAEDKTVNAGEIVTIDVTANNFNEVFGYQFTAKMNGMELMEVKSGAITVDESNYGVPTAGTMTMSWSSEKAVNAAEGEVLFTVVMKATENGRLSNMMSVGSDVTRSESYAGSEMETNRLDLSFRTNESEVAGYALYQNEPNPFKTNTVVNFNMPTAGEATFTVTDVTGKLVHTRKVNAVKGMNKVEFNRTDVPVSGVVYYTIESGDFTATKAMIVIE